MVTDHNWESLKTLAQAYPLIPVFKILPAHTRSPLDTFRILKTLSRQCFILESLEDTEHWGRYTFLGYDPKLEITCTNGTVRIKNGTCLQFQTHDPGSYIKHILEENRSPCLPELPPFSGGLVGYFSYDYIKYQEPTLNLDAADAEGFKDLDLMLFDKLIAYDHTLGRLILINHIKTNALKENYNRALGELEHLAALIQTATVVEPMPLRICSSFRWLFDKEQYCTMVQRAKAYIREGDIFQVVLSNRLEAEAEGSLFHTYQVLRRLNPSPYMFYFSSDDLEIAGASPETMVKLVGDEVFTFPLAGTRPRGKTQEEDAALEQDLLRDAKELAEHTMLVDLGRNDLGKIAAFGSVRVKKYRSVEKFSHVMHLGSTVQGRLVAGKSALDAIDAVLPAGTLSGAPKIRSCQIINELENNKRGIYGGAIGYLGFAGAMDTCIAIRLVFKKNGKVFIRSGAGIVADSVPSLEFEECKNKLKAVLLAMEEAGSPGVGHERKEVLA
ncbi:MAG: anthranilate synthase component I family protein [Treponema sp.]|jgi:anthranilate synthase component 1|nr:anthranilate synthase component I family protein [Treponema sp.]